MEKIKNIVLIEDNHFFAEILIAGLQQNNQYKVQHYTSADVILKEDTIVADIIILDYYLGSNLDKIENGLEILPRLKAKYKDLPVIMLTVSKDIELAVELFRLGATDYIIKDEFAIDNLNKTINNIFLVRKLRNENDHLKNKTNKYRKQLAITLSSVFLTVFLLLMIFYY